MNTDTLCSLVSTDIFAIIFSTGILIFAIFGIIAFLKEIKPVICQLKKMIPILEAQPGELEFRKNFDDLNNAFKECPVLGHQWHEFVEGTLLSDNSVKNTKEAGHYFNRDTILYGYVNLSFYNSLPNILTGLGILGTFLGLLSGVSQVSIKDITTIEGLLGGAAVAFSTSISGLLSSIVFTLILKILIFRIDALIQKWVTALDKRLEWISPEKVTYQLFLQQLEQSKIMEAFAEKIGVSIGEVLNKDTNSQLSVLKEILKKLSIINSDSLKESIEGQTQKIQKTLGALYGGLTEQNKQIISASRENGQIIISAINTALDGNKETLKAIQVSTNKQLEDIHTTSEKTLFKATSGFEQLNNNFKEFISHMAERNSDALIEALEVVIKDFNLKITEQFGDNFKQLNEAVGQLLKWQINYRDTIEQISKNLDHQFKRTDAATEAIEKQSHSIVSISKSLEGAEKNLSKLSLASHDIETQVGKINEQNAILHEFLQGISNLGAEAKKVLPSISSNIEAHITNLSTTVDSATKGLNEITTGLKNLTDEVSEKIRMMVEEHSKQADYTSEILKENLENTLNNSLKTMAGHLAALSGKFVSDYTPLTERLKELVHLSEKVSPQN